jgi:dipeptidyl aminopeptidase/acylaminoacyl peptidase
MLTRSTRRDCLSTLVVLVLGASLEAGQSPAAATRRPELADYYRLENAGAAAISPDGRSVAFVRSFIVEDDNRRMSEIWLGPADGSSAPIRITSPAFSSTAPRWSPDGLLLAFTSRRPAPAAVPKARSGSCAWIGPAPRPFKLPA